jgi:hypothetical protein
MSNVRLAFAIGPAKILQERNSLDCYRFFLKRPMVKKGWVGVEPYFEQGQEEMLILRCKHVTTHFSKELILLSTNKSLSGN